MDLTRRCACALAVAGAVIFVSKVCWAEEAVSAVSLSAPATGAVLLVEEPFICPLVSKEADIVSPFGKREILAPPTTATAESPAAKVEMHEGIDYSANPGTLVRAARSGKVIFAGFSKMYASRTNKNEQHRFVIIRHADGLSSRYVHLNGLRVRPGQDVKSGQAIGVVAESDEWVVPVFHFEIRDIQGRPVDPETMIKEVENP
jgi:murein DD-endopeptidase MepM/ murein hydrolase activator NlpD